MKKLYSTDLFVSNFSYCYLNISVVFVQNIVQLMLFLNWYKVLENGKINFEFVFLTKSVIQHNYLQNTGSTIRNTWSAWCLPSLVLVRPAKRTQQNGMNGSSSELSHQKRSPTRVYFRALSFLSYTLKLSRSAVENQILFCSRSVLEKEIFLVIEDGSETGNKNNYFKTMNIKRCCKISEWNCFSDLFVMYQIQTMCNNHFYWLLKLVHRYVNTEKTLRKLFCV